jgi:hypothetical protein
VSITDDKARYGSGAGCHVRQLRHGVNDHLGVWLVADLEAADDDP